METPNPQKNTPPEKAIPHVLFDHGRAARIGLPEAVFCQGKSQETLLHLLQSFNQNSGHAILFTRLEPDIFYSFPADIQAGVNYHPLSRTAFARALPPRNCARVAVVSAGTADGPVTWEAARTLEYLGIPHTVYEDCGVAGLWRLEQRLPEINSHDILIVVAGLDAALASLMGGLTSKPLFTVPTSTGYGMAENGKSALSSMLISCAPGAGVMNIDNGFGAACAAARIVNLLEERS